MQMVIKPFCDDFDVVTVDVKDIRKIYLSEYGLSIELNDFNNDIRVIDIDVLLCDEYEIEIKE